MKKHLLPFLLIGIHSSIVCHSQLSYTKRVIADSLFIPWEIIYGPDNNIWFTQKNGYICRLDLTTEEVDTLYHETNSAIQGEGGMLGLAIHPGFPAQPYLYTAYEYWEDDAYKERIVRYTYTSDSLAAPMILLEGIRGGAIHNGCRLLIKGEQLLITTGDAGDSDLPQDMSSLNGKVLRINLDGSIPADNPDPSNPVWSTGHRNAQGLVFHDGHLYSSEHGPDSDDEINLITKGANYGWPQVRGFCNEPDEMSFCTDSAVTEPLIAWTPTIAAAGLDYYDHPMFPSLQNSLLLTTLKDNNLYHLVLNATGDSIISEHIIEGIDEGRLRDICISPEGRIYLSTSNSPASGTGDKTDRIIELYDPAYNGIFASEKESREVIVYPNPAGDLLHVYFTHPDYSKLAWSYILLNTEGKALQEGILENKRIDLNHLNPGVYFLRGKSGDKTFFRRVVKW